MSKVNYSFIWSREIFLKYFWEQHNKDENERLKELLNPPLNPLERILKVIGNTHKDLNGGWDYKYIAAKLTPAKRLGIELNNEITIACQKRLNKMFKEK